MNIQHKQRCKNNHSKLPTSNRSELTCNPFNRTDPSLSFPMNRIFLKFLCLSRHHRSHLKRNLMKGLAKDRAPLLPIGKIWYLSFHICLSSLGVASFLHLYSMATAKADLSHWRISYLQLYKSYSSSLICTFKPRRVTDPMRKAKISFRLRADAVAKSSLRWSWSILIQMFALLW